MKILSLGRRSAWEVLAVTACIAAGCNRPYYRKQADEEVYGMVRAAANDPRWPLTDYTIQPRCESRMFDPYDPDKSPMPPDDSTSHRLMHCVNGKKGWKHWHRNGCTPYTENPTWKAYLPYDESGVVSLDRTGAVSMAFLNSREYQSAQEEVYLAALSVSYQRFQFQTQFYGLFTHQYTSDGRYHSRDDMGVPYTNEAPVSELRNTTTLGASRYMATGGQLIVEAANSIVWQFGGDTDENTWTLLNFNFVQPLLRAAGRAYVLENLTESERKLLMSIRHLERYRRGMVMEVLNGRSRGPSPDADGVAITSLSPAIALAAGVTSATGVTTGGMLGLLADQRVIDNQRENVSGLVSSVEQLESVYSAGRITRFQVDLARQSLYNAQSQLLLISRSHQDRLESVKMTLGLPPDLPIRLNDPMLKQFALIDPASNELEDRLAAFLREVRDSVEVPDRPTFERWLQTLGGLGRDMERFLDMLDQDMRVLEATLPARHTSLETLVAREEAKRGDVDARIISGEDLDQRVAVLKANLAKQTKAIQAMLDQWEEVVTQTKIGDDEESRKELRVKIRSRGQEVSRQLSQAMLVQAETRLETLALVPVELDPREAFEIARCKRRDWMNARAMLVDVWRQIEVSANALKSKLNLKFSGDVGTKDNDPFKFASTTGRIRMGLEFDPPLSRLAQRNAYRAALIEYQRTRRAYYAFVDRVNQYLRFTLRQIRYDQLNFEIRRRAVSLAVTQVDRILYDLARPPKPGEASQLSNTLARDLVDSYSSLLSAENQLVTVFVDHESQRLNLNFDMGIMELDQNGMWLDPGPVEPSGMLDDEKPEEVPLPEHWLQSVEGKVDWPAEQSPPEQATEEQGRPKAE
jgi:hypothetical protein